MLDPNFNPVIRVRGLHNRFGAQVVHDGLDMEVQQNEIFGVVGGSGTGKSVLLRSILGLMHPRSGSVELYGRDVESLAVADRDSLVQSYGVTFQNGALISSLTVAQNVQLPLREHYSLSEKTLDELADMNLLMVGLPPDAGAKFPSQLSGGMIKRAALARALVLEPKLLFLDEPTAGLDPIGAAHYDELIGELRKNLGLTVLMVTHDLDSLYAVCDRVAVLLDKRVVAGTIEELLAYDHPWVQEYFRGPRGRAAARQESSASHG